MEKTLRKSGLLIVNGGGHIGYDCNREPAKQVEIEPLLPCGLTKWKNPGVNDELHPKGEEEPMPPTGLTFKK